MTLIICDFHRPISSVAFGLESSNFSNEGYGLLLEITNCHKISVFRLKIVTFSMQKI